MTQAPVTVEVTPPVTPAAEPPTTEPRQEQTIPYSRFKDVNDQLAALKQKDADREAAEKKAADKRAKDQGEWERLAAERETELTGLKPQVTTLQERTKAFEDVMAAQVKERIKALSAPAQKAFERIGSDVLTQFAALPEFEALSGVTVRTGGTPAGPAGTGGQILPQTNGDLIARKKASGDYD